MKIVDIRKISTTELTADSTKLREEIAELKTPHSHGRSSEH